MHHVYVDYRVDTNVPFYVGKGDDSRIADFKNRNVIWHRIARKHGIRREIVLTLENDHDTIVSEEIRLIRELKTRDYHDGANLTDGGEGSLGWNPSLETRERMRQRKLGTRFSNSHRNNMSKARQKYYELDSSRKRTSEEQKKTWSNPVHRQKMSAAHAGESNARAVLTEQDVRDIRVAWDAYDASKRGATKAFCVEYVQKLSLTPENIYGIVKRKSWKHLP